MRVFWTTVLALSTLLGGCDYFAQRDLKPGLSTQADVRRYMGTPEIIWEEPDGSRVYEYVRSPLGHETWMVLIGPDGTYQRMENVLVAARFAKVATGQSRDDVRRYLGKPTEIEYFERRDEEVWSWRHKGQVWESAMFHVYFGPDGRVLRTETMRDPKLDNAS